MRWQNVLLLNCWALVYPTIVDCRSRATRFNKQCLLPEPLLVQLRSKFGNQGSNLVQTLTNVLSGPTKVLSTKLVDSLGRRTLLLWGSATQTVAMAALMELSMFW